MNRKKIIFLIILFLFVATQIVVAQQKPVSTIFSSRSANDDESQPAVYYRLDFTIRETDGDKPVDTRNYSLWVQSGIAERMTAGSEVPYFGATFNSSSGSTRNINYRNVGISIDCTVKEGNNSPRLDLRLNISDVIPAEKDSDKTTFRNVTLDSRALLSLGKPTTVSIVEDPASGHRFQVDVTATRLE